MDVKHIGSVSQTKDPYLNVNIIMNFSDIMVGRISVEAGQTHEFDRYGFYFII